MDERWVQAQLRRNDQYRKDIAKLMQADLSPADTSAQMAQGNLLMQKAKLFQEIADITHDPGTICQAAIADAQVKLWKIETNQRIERTHLAIKYSKYSRYEPDEE